MRERTLARFMSKIEVQPNGCWYWIGTITKDGYGVFSTGNNKLAHRVAYEHFIGEIPEDMHVDHLCHTADPTCLGGRGDPHRRCVRPECLEVVTPSENHRRGNAPSAINARKTHCDRGHEFTPENTYRPKKGGRECRACRDASSKAWMAVHNPGVRHGTETHCPQNHPYSGDNLYINPANGGRVCRECKRASDRESMRRKRAREKAARAAA